MPRTATLNIDGKIIELPITVGSEGEHAIDVTKLRDETGYITLDPGYRNTGSCVSDITFIDAEKGILRYRGYAIEELAEKSSFMETAKLLIDGKLPDANGLTTFMKMVGDNTAVNPGLLSILKGFPQNANPMAMLSACINGLGGYHPEVLEIGRDDFDLTAAKLIAKVRTLAAAIYRHSLGKPAIDPADIAGPPIPQNYTAKFLQMMFGEAPKPEVARALDLIFLLHADHEQNCSASTCRMVGSSHANLFASCAAAVCALWGPLHGGANVEIMNQLEQIHKDGIDPDDFLKGVKEKKYRLSGFGHPIYRNYDPRARILKQSVEKLRVVLGTTNDPLLKIARRLEEVALADDYFVSRKLYPNVDFYSGIIMRAMGVPTEMFTVLFAVGRMPGWIAQWKEVRDQKGKIYRPRQIYTGPTGGKYTPVESR